MPKTIFDYGETVRTTNTYTNPDDGLVADPLAVSVVVRAPDGTETTYIYGTDSELDKVSTGIYEFYLSLDQAGTYKWYWSATTVDGVTKDYDECDSVRKF